MGLGVRLKGFIGRGESEIGCCLGLFGRED